ncbi:MAG: hypothetical protein ACOCSK_02595 [Rhodothermales bacterium]
MKHIHLPYTTAVLFLALVLAGCDAILPADEEVVVDHIQEFRFELTRQQVIDGVAVNAEAPLNVEPTLNSIGFTRDMLIAAEASSASLRMTLADVADALSAASIRVGSGTSQTEIAAAQQIGQGAQVSLSTTGANIGGLVRSGNPTVSLLPEAVDDLGDRSTYVFRLTVTVRMTLQSV